jgi:hypothetical protein
MSNVSPDEVHDVIAALKADLSAREISDTSLADERSAILGAWSNTHANPSCPARHELPACRHLEAAIAAGLIGPARQLTRTILPLLDSFHWRYGYPFDPRWPDLSERVAFTQIIGERGLLTDDSALLGLTLIAPWTHYPLHSHPAIELYLVITGSADWRLEGARFARKPPGALILHRSGIGHAVKTEAEPLLALWVWRGDLGIAPVYVDDSL